MRPDNIQCSDDTISYSESIPNDPKDTSSPSAISSSSEEYITFFDFTSLLESIENILKTQIDTPITNQTSLQKLAYGLKEIRKSQVLENIPVVTSIGKNETFNSWKMDMERAATWLTYFDEFCTLKSEEKMLITKCMWLLFRRLERSAMTADLRRAKKCQKSEYAMKTDSLVSMETKYEFDWLSHFSAEQIKVFLGSSSGMYCEELTNCIMEVQPSDEELCFIICDLCFQYLGIKVGGEIQQKLEGLQKILSDNLHNYYLERNREHRYTYRLSQLMKISQQYNKLMEEKRRVGVVGEVFGVFRVKWSHPDIFKYARFE